MTLLFFGDSLTWGGYGGDYVSEIRKQIGDNTPIINAGVGGNTVINLHRRLERDVCAHTPDKVLVMVGGNDAVSYAQPDTRPYYRKSMGLPDGFVSPGAFSQHYRDLLAQLQANYIETYIALEPMEANPTVAAAQLTFNELARDAARAFNVPILDLYAHLMPDEVPPRPPINAKSIQLIGERGRTGWSDWYTEQEKYGYAYSFDGVHWTPKVAAQVAAQVIDFMGLRPQPAAGS